MDNIRYIDGVKVYFDEVWCCDFEEYIKAKKQQNQEFSEESFCNWCEANNLEDVG